MLKSILAIGIVLAVGSVGGRPQAPAPLPPTVSIPLDQMHSRPDLTDTQVQQWSTVAWCETHADWDRNQPNFDGGLGISRVVWIENGGLQYAAAPHLATPREQIRIAVRINDGYAVPDQHGTCAPW